MSLASGSRLGPYEIVAPIGAGGMGEVFRARDPRLGRDVAVKVLPPAVAGDAERTRRFEVEARAVARLTHPNVLQVFDVGTHEGRPYLVTELLDGETLRAALERGPLPVRKAIEVAIAVAYGLAAAHEQHIVHRDLKPENLYLTRDGRVKILDFGLAKLTQAGGDGATHTNAPTLAANTAAGLVLGTVGYMSPEQVRGQAADERSDLFAFGSILYEMVSGARAFKGDSAADTMSAILREDPPDLGTLDREIPPVLDRIVRHCLEKSPAQRFHSAHDLAFQLEAISTLSSSGAVAAVTERVARGPMLFQRQTYRRGMLLNARFAPDGQAIVYSAEWEGEPARLYMKRPESPDSIPLPLPEADVLAISKSGELAIQLSPRHTHNGSWSGTMALAPLFGGAPREIAEVILHADHASGGEDLLVSRDVGGRGRLEYPLDHVLYETPGYVSHPRLSPAGDRIAFCDHPLAGDDRGYVALCDLQGNVKRLTDVWTTLQGLAWSPSGDEVWFTAAAAGSCRSLYAVTAGGTMRCVSGFPGSVRLFDISKDGRLLLAAEDIRVGVMALAPGEERERDLTWLNWSLPGGISADGRTIAFDESTEEVGPNYVACVRKTDGSPVVRLNEGSAAGISPDGRWVVTKLPSPESPLVVVPVGAGRKRVCDTHGIQGRFVTWAPDNRHFLWHGRDADGVTRARVIDRETGESRLLALEDARHRRGCAVSPDGAFAVFGFPPETAIVPLDGGPVRPGPRIEDSTESGEDAAESVVGISPDGEWLWVTLDRSAGIRLTRVHMTSGAREVVRTFEPADRSGIVRLGHLKLARDGESYCYFFGRVLSELYAAEGVE